jgi:hypothetical protein
MRTTTVAALIAAACAATLAAAAPVLAEQPTHLSDAQFVEANRCLGLMTSKTLGTPDAAAMKQLVKSQDSGRISFIDERAEQARDDAERQANHAGADNASLIAERDGVCRTLIGSGSEAAGPHAASQMLR